MNTFTWVFVEVFQNCHSFNFANMRFVVKVIFFLLNSTRRFTFKESLLQNFVFSFFTLTYVPLNEYIPFCRKQFSLSFNKRGKLQVFALYLPKCLCLCLVIMLLIKQ